MSAVILPAHEPFCFLNVIHDALKRGMISVHRKAGLANNRFSGAFGQSVVLIECLARNHTADRIYAVSAFCELREENQNGADPSLSCWKIVADAQAAT